MLTAQFHIFCDAFGVDERLRLPASRALLESFAIWAASSGPVGDPREATVPYEPVSTESVSNYMSDVRAWHIAQGWGEPLSKRERDEIGFVLRGLANVEPARKRPPRPGVKESDLRAFGTHLDHNDPFDAAVWALLNQGFLSLARMGELTCRSSFDPTQHPSRGDMSFGTTSRGCRYVKIALPRCKTDSVPYAQSLWAYDQDGIGLRRAIDNHLRVNQLEATDPVFGYRATTGVKPLTYAAVRKRLVEVCRKAGAKCRFGHSLRIGGATYFLKRGVPVEWVRMIGRWRSLAFQRYIRDFEEIADLYLGLPRAGARR